MSMRLYLIVLTFLLGVLVVVPGCPPYGGEEDDDDATDADGSDDDDVSDDDDDVYLPVTFVGEVIGLDRETGEVLSTDEYLALAGAIVVYLVSDPADLSDPAGKATLVSPGEFSITVDPNPGPLYLLAISDWTRNAIIDPADVIREYAGNPIYSGLGGEQEAEIFLDLQIFVDLGDHGGGGTPVATTNISGPVTLVNIDDGPLAVAAFRDDGGGWPIYNKFDQASDYSLDVRDPWDLARVIGFIDKDLNGMFEPSDWVGELTSNPVQLGIGDLAGAEIVIPSGDPSSLPAPTGYIDIQGDVTYSDYSGGEIVVSISDGSPSGQLFGRQTLAAPGAFAVRAPVARSGLVVWGLAEDGAMGVIGPFSTGMVDEVGVNLVLEAGAGTDNAIGGEIAYSGPMSSDDSLTVALFEYSADTPLTILSVPNPSFPASYEFSGLPVGVYRVAGALDFGSDFSGEPEPDEPWGEWASEIALTGGTNADAISFVLDQFGG